MNMTPPGNLPEGPTLTTGGVVHAGAVKVLN